MGPASLIVVSLIVALIVYINKADTKKRAFPRFVQKVVQQLGAPKPIFSGQDVQFEFKHDRHKATLQLIEEAQPRAASIKMRLAFELKSLPLWFRIMARDEQWQVEADGTTWSGHGPLAISTLFTLSDAHPTIEHQSIPMTINEVLKRWNYGLFDADSTWSLSELQVENRQVYFVATMPWKYATSQTLVHETISVVSMVINAIEHISTHLPEIPWAFWSEMDERHASGESWSIAALCWMLRTHSHRDSVKARWLHAVEHAPVEFLVEPASQNVAYALDAIVDAPWDDAYYLDFLARAHAVLMPQRRVVYEEILNRLAPELSEDFVAHVSKRHSAALKDIAIERLKVIPPEALLEWVSWIDQADAVELALALMPQAHRHLALLEVVAKNITQAEHGEAFAVALYEYMKPKQLAQTSFVSLALLSIPYTKTPQINWLIEALQKHISPDGFALVRQMQQSPQVQNAPTRIRFAYRDIIEALESQHERMATGGLSLSVEPTQGGALSVSQVDDGQLSITDEEV